MIGYAVLLAVLGAVGRWATGLVRMLDEGRSGTATKAHKCAEIACVGNDFERLTSGDARQGRHRDDVHSR
jgi:hypothetical protein